MVFANANLTSLIIIIHWWPMCVVDGCKYLNIAKVGGKVIMAQFLIIA